MTREGIWSKGQIQTIKKLNMQIPLEVKNLIIENTSQLFII